MTTFSSQGKSMNLHIAKCEWDALKAIDMGFGNNSLDFNPAQITPDQLRDLARKVRQFSLIASHLDELSGFGTVSVS